MKVNWCYQRRILSEYFQKRYKSFLGKKAFVMPLVLGFFCLSHLIYIGILKQQQVQLQRLNEYHNYYQARIQLEIFQQVFLKDDKYWIDFLNKQLASMCQQQFDMNNRQRDLLPIIHHPQWRLSKIKNTNHYYLLERVDIYTDPLTSDYIHEQLDFEFSGTLNQGLPVNTFSKMKWQNDYLEQMTNLKDLNFEEEELPIRNIQQSVTEERPFIPPLSFDKGQVYVQNGKEAYKYQLVSRLRSGFQTQDTYELRAIKVLSQWQGIVFKPRDIDDSV